MIQVKHDLGDVGEGETVIVTLADKPLLDERGNLREGDEPDELENVLVVGEGCGQRVCIRGAGARAAGRGTSRRTYYGACTGRRQGCVGMRRGRVRGGVHRCIQGHTRGGEYGESRRGRCGIASLLLKQSAFRVAFLLAPNPLHPSVVLLPYPLPPG